MCVFFEMLCLHERMSVRAMSVFVYLCVFLCMHVCVCFLVHVWECVCVCVSQYVSGCMAER